MTITRELLIGLCDKFINGQIDKMAIKDFAWNAITSDSTEWEEDNIISETLFEWDNEDINYEINTNNIQLWKNRLESGVDELQDYNSWNAHIERQKEICLANNSKWNPINKKLKIGVSLNLSRNPINGLRHPAEEGTTGWFIWTGEYTENDDFFQPICADDLLQVRPDIIKYLGLDAGFRFLADNHGYQDIWYDESLRKI